MASAIHRPMGKLDLAAGRPASNREPLSAHRATFAERVTVCRIRVRFQRPKGCLTGPQVQVPMQAYLTTGVLAVNDDDEGKMLEDFQMRLRQMVVMAKRPLCDEAELQGDFQYGFAQFNVAYDRYFSA